jgi:hypothetical protein
MMAAHGVRGYWMTIRYSAGWARTVMPLLELGRGGGLAKVVGGLPLGDVDVAELRVWVEALVQPAGDEPGLLAHPLGGVLPVSEELLLLAVGTSKALTSTTLMDGSFAVVAWAPPW